MRLLKLIAFLVVAALIALVGYAYFGDMQPVRSEVRSPIAGAPAAPAAGTETE